MQKQQALRLFVSYATEDEPYRTQLEQSLAGMRRAGLVETWTFRAITPGEDLDDAINSSLDRADIVALLVSPAFLNSDYCWNVEMKRAIERQDRGETVVVPIIIRSCVWDDTPFARLNALPTDAKPIGEWGSRDEAWTSVARGIRTMILGINAGGPPPRRVLNAAAPGLLGRDAEGFLTIENVLHLVLSRVQGRQKPLDKPILLFENSFQRTWLVFTERVIACVLDDITKNELYDPLRWDCRHRFALPVEVAAYKPKIGLLHLGPEHRDWLYSVSLHPDPRTLKTTVEFLLQQSEA